MGSSNYPGVARVFFVKGKIERGGTLLKQVNFKELKHLLYNYNGIIKLSTNYPLLKQVDFKQSKLLLGDYNEIIKISRSNLKKR